RSSNRGRKGHDASALAIVMYELPFSGQPVFDIVAAPPPARLVEMESQASDLVLRRALAVAAGECVHRAFAGKCGYDVGTRHGCILGARSGALLSLLPFVSVND